MENTEFRKIPSHLNRIW